MRFELVSHMIYWFSFWACNLKRSRLITLPCFFIIIFLYLYNCRAISTEVIQLCSKYSFHCEGPDTKSCTSWKWVMELTLSPARKVVKQLWSGKGWPLTAKNAAAITFEYWMSVRSRAYSWRVRVPSVLWVDLNIFTPETCLIPMSSFYYSEVHGSPKAQFPKCVKGN